MSRGITESRFWGFTVIATLVVALGLGSSTFAQEGDPEERPAVPDDENKAAELLGEEEHPILKLVDEISDNMKLIEELLNQRNTGSDCQSAQSKTLEKMDLLIEEMEKACSGSSSSSSSSQSRRPKQRPEDQKQGKQQQQMADKKQQQQTEPRNPEESPNTRTSEGAVPPVEVGSLEDREGVGRWGRLPKRVVEQMYDNGRRKLPEKYRILLEEYFGRLPQNDK